MSNSTHVHVTVSVASSKNGAASMDSQYMRSAVTTCASELEGFELEALTLGTPELGEPDELDNSCRWKTCRVFQ